MGLEGIVESCITEIKTLFSSASANALENWNNRNQTQLQGKEELNSIFNNFSNEKLR